ncbi:uncharacterized protein LOC122509386 [Leptopilina heterotoma]|uniref:uncharacterized protein LOC122509386 n=1 Tax=Leptopilina heterotoma TaxID=63436 RepID=UPI001CA8E3CA|nr:uncharacterized protein LOC122509386 [Leptopilina heterotoma]
MFGRNLHLSFSRIFRKININEFRFIHKIVHNPNRGIFYVKLGNNEERAVLTYKKNGKILDLRTISVPKEHQEEGLARRLTEEAFTYAIVNDYHMYLTCVYIQKYYLVIKNAELEERVIGPPNVLEFPYAETTDPGAIYEIPDPEDFMIKSPKS